MPCPSYQQLTSAVSIKVMPSASSLSNAALQQQLLNDEDNMDQDKLVADACTA